MPLPPFHGNTFVAFVDISGFKRMLESTPDEAIQALNSFYSAAFHILRDPEKQMPVHGLLVSDCAVLYVEPEGAAASDALECLLQVVRRLNKESLESGLMLTTSVAYGAFHYEERLEFRGIEKNLMTGYAYVSAYIDSCAKSPQLRCGDCRIVAKNLPADALTALEQRQGSVFSMTNRKGQDHFYYYWMRKRPNEISTYEAASSDVENLKFQAIRLLLKGSTALEVRKRRN